MASNARDGRRDSGQNLEDEFFRREDQLLLDRMRELGAKQTARESLAKASGITDPAVLDKLMELKIQPETVAALSVVPLVEVAWADGTLDAKERLAVLAHARETGIVPGSAEYALLEAWLDRRPEQRLLTAWNQLIKGLTAELGPAETSKLRSTLLERARGVARASGGVLGLGSKVSKAEATMLARLEAAFGPSR